MLSTPVAGSPWLLLAGIGLMQMTLASIANYTHESKEILKEIGQKSRGPRP